MTVREADVAAADLGYGRGAGAAYDDATGAVSAEFVVRTGPAVGEAVAAWGVDAEHELGGVVARHVWGGHFGLVVCFVEEGGTWLLVCLWIRGGLLRGRKVLGFAWVVVSPFFHALGL